MPHGLNGVMHTHAPDVWHMGEYLGKQFGGFRLN